MKLRKRSALTALLALGAVGAGTAGAATDPPTSRGPNSNTDPYVVPVAEGASTKSLLTVSDGNAADNGYQMVGIPDGLGALRAPNGRDFTLFMNQELRNTQGIPRRHGQRGAFVSRYEIDAKSFGVENGSDLIDPGVRYYNYAAGTYGPAPSPGQSPAFSRFCSSSLTDPGVLDDKSRSGYGGQLYFANEENGDEGRVFGVTTGGEAQQLPRLGLASWENTNAAHTGNRTTFTLGDEDGSSGQLWAHIGQKQDSGNAFDRAGLTNGDPYVVDLADETTSTDAEYRAKYGKHNPQRFTIGSAEKVNWNQPGAAQNTEAGAKGLSLNRIEDGAFDPRNPDDYYFTTTEGGKGATPARDGGGFWRLRFDDVSKPQNGGTLTLLLDGSEAPFLSKPDNVTVDRKGNVLIQEDPGNDPHIARIVAYRIADGARGVLAQFDPTKFGPGGGSFITQDEESSGIIDARKLLGRGWFLFDAQVHRGNLDPEKVEYGQLLAMRVRKFKEVYTIR